MPSWTHLVQSLTIEDNQVHLGQLVDTTRDAGRDSADGLEIAVYVIDGTVFDSRLLSPVSRDECSYVRCLGLNYTDHAKKANLPLPKVPTLFMKPRTALSGPFPAEINVPKCAYDGTSDYEAEPCLVIGKSGRDIPERRVLEHVLGYTASNDVSVLTLQLLTAQCLSVIEDPQSLAKQISYLSQGTILEAGTIILMGTPAGIGYFRPPRVVLQNGDEIYVEIGKIRTLINKVRYDSW
ncbi:hypothetical protein BDV09DRAFT_189702 [Aspergillus tetrazonus]